MKKKSIKINGYRGEIFSLNGLTTVGADDDIFVVEIGFKDIKPKMVNKLYHTIGTNNIGNRLYKPRI